MSTDDRTKTTPTARPAAAMAAMIWALGACSVDPANPPAEGGPPPASAIDGASTAPTTSAPDVAIGAPIEAPDGRWTRVPIPEGRCRHGGEAYMMVRLNSRSKKVVVYEEGGGACFNDSSCTFLNFNPPSYLLGGGLFNFRNEENPVRDWNVFYLPYCTGDVQAGNRPSVEVGPVTGTTGFHGYVNMRLYLARILGTVPDATDFFLTGSSGGGFGAGLTADLFVRNLPASVERFTLVDDSGIPLGDGFLPACLQRRWREVWGFDDSFLAYCGDACPHDDVFVSDYVRYIVDRYGSDPGSDRIVGGFISSDGDAIMRMFFGYGGGDCASPRPLDRATYAAGIADLRETLVARSDRFGTFYFDSTLHTTLLVDRAISIGGVGIGGLYDTESDGVRLVDWLRDLLERRVVRHVGP